MQNTTQMGTLTKVGVVVGVTAVFIGGLWLMGGTSEAKGTEYMSRVPELQAAYDRFELDVTKTRCNYIKELAKAKLEDDMVTPMAGIDRNDLAAKRDMNCDF